MESLIDKGFAKGTLQRYKAATSMYRTLSITPIGEMIFP